jgi:hypothetical protein
VAIGDKINDLHWFNGSVATIADILPALQSLIKEHYATSAYAK